MSTKKDPKGAEPQPDPPQHPVLAQAIETFNQGNYRGARALLPQIPTELSGDDPRWRARLEKALKLDPALLGTMVVMGLVWLVLFWRVALG